MKKIIYLSIFLGFVFPFSVFAEPLPWGIAINQQTQECAAFWGGDEFIENTLPEGWKDYYPSDYKNNPIVIKTEAGACDFIRGKEKECCQQIGLSFAETINIKSQQTDWAKQNIDSKNNNQAEAIRQDSNNQNIQENPKQNPEKFYYKELLIAITLITIISLFVWQLKKKKT